MEKEERITEFQDKRIDYLNLIPEVYEDLKFVGITTVSKLIEEAKAGYLYYSFSKIWPKRYYEYISAILYLRCDLNLSDVKIPKEISIKIPTRYKIRISIYEPIQRLGLETEILKELEKANIQTIVELIQLAKTGKLYEKIPDCPKRYFEEINFELWMLCGLWLPGLKQLKLRPSDKVYELTFNKKNYKDFSDGLSNIGIRTIGELVSLTRQELHALPEIRDKNLQPLGKEIYSQIETAAHDAGLKFADEVEETIDITQKPIAVLGFSKKTISRLYLTGNIKLVSGLIAKTKSELRIFMTKEMLDEIITKLNSHGLELANKDITMAKQTDAPLSMSLENTREERIKQLKRLKTALQAVLELRNKSEKQDKKVGTELRMRREELLLKERGTAISKKRMRNELLRLRRGPLTRGRSISRRMLINQREAQKVLKKEEKPTIIILYER